jgi:hypothetical protein
MGALAELRARAAAALVDLDPDWQVFDGPVDSLAPPCFLLAWSEPWLPPAAVCSVQATLQIICVGARVDPLPGYEQIELLVEAALPALQAARFAYIGTSAPAQHEHGGLQYLAARITVTNPIPLGV